jgi:uncharacterized membrane protein YuzA (DUF378 family)
MNKDNPLTNVILAIIVIAGLLFAWFIGKTTFHAKEDEASKPDTKVNAFSIWKNIVYLIIGIILIWLASKLWFAIVGKPKDL